MQGMRTPFRVPGAAVLFHSGVSGLSTQRPAEIDITLCRELGVDEKIRLTLALDFWGLRRNAASEAWRTAAGGCRDS